MNSILNWTIVISGIDTDKTKLIHQKENFRWNYANYSCVVKVLENKQFSLTYKGQSMDWGKHTRKVNQILRLEWIEE